MDVIDQLITDRYALYHGDCVDVVSGLPDDSVHLSIYSPPFAGLYHYSSSERDMSNCRSYEEFMEHYRFVVEQIGRVTIPGCVSAVHCTDIPSGNTGHDRLRDFPGDIIRMHESMGWAFCARYAVWKDPFKVYIRTLRKSLRHRTIVDDSSRCSVANADYMLMFRRPGDRPKPVSHPIGLTSYAGEREVPKKLLKYRGWTGKQTENKYSQWVWRQYASAFWDDVRLDRVLPFVDARDDKDEAHVHPLQLDVIERSVVLWSNPGEKVLTPFMGVGSEVFEAVRLGRFGIGVELKASYYRQSVANLETVDVQSQDGACQTDMFAGGAT